MNNLCLLFMFVAVSLIGRFNAKTLNEKASFQHISDNNYTKVLRDHLITDDSRSLIAIMFTNNKCETCDIFEP